MSDRTGQPSDETTGAGEQRFVCPDCAAEIAVNSGVRSAILEHGCPVCTATVTDAAFE